MNRARRILSGWVLVALGLTVPLGAHALGLGEARVESFLNQPLDVRMRLLDVTEDDLDSLTVAPADAADYERLGLLSESLALRLEVRVDRSVSPPVIYVVSDRAVTAPVVQLLIDARWANGRMLREYTLFLDPATVAVDAPAPATAQSTPSRAADPEPRTRPAPDPAPRPSSAPAPSQPVQQQSQQQPQPRAVARTGGDRYGPVDSGETLWSIARANLAAGDVTMNQMMIAIVELNPRAFRDGNINRLLRGADLRLPDAEQARALDEAVAAAEVAAQNRSFRQRTAADTPVVSGSGRAGARGREEPATAEAPGRAAGPSDNRADAGDEAGESRLSLVPPGEEESGSGQSDQGASEVAELRQRLARAEEELFSARQEAEEFQSRVEELEALVRDNPGAVGIQDAELAGLQRTLRAAREATREGADPAERSRVSRRLDNYLEQFGAAEEGAEERTDSALADAPGETPEADDSGDAGAGTPAAETPDSRADAGPAPAPAPEPERSDSPGDAPGLFGNPLLVLFVGLVVLLLLLAAVRFGLRRRKAAEAPGLLEPRVPAPPQPAADADTPLARARDRVKSQPADLGAHLGLLETLAAEGHEARFGDALEEMFEHVESGDEPEWREALELSGRIVPGHSLVKGSSDWVSGSVEAESSEADSSKAASEIDEESEVDDLMARLDADLDESDDRDWLGEEGSEKPAPEGPLLRDDEDSSPEASSGQDEGSFRFTETAVLDPIDVDEDSPVDFGEWGDAEEEAVSDHDSGVDEGDADVDDLILDWDAGEDKAEDVGAPATSADEAESSDGAEAEDDIFAQSDDDIDVKLDLAKAYLSWHSTDSARTLLKEVLREGNESQQQEARKLLEEAAGEDED